jgi:uncharacterized protein (TIGR04376 family)
MGLFDEVSRFLEDRLDEYLRDHPELELQALLEQLQEQQQDTQKLILQLQRQENSLQDQILALAKDIQVWHARITKAKAANRDDLAQAATERESALLRQGNQLWGQMEGVKQRLAQAKELYTTLQRQIQEVKLKAAQTSKQQTTADSRQTSKVWDNNNSSYSRQADPLEDEFLRWEINEEIERMKENL